MVHPLARKITPEEMIARYRTGETFKQIAEVAGLTRERVRQIVRKRLGKDDERGNRMIATRTKFTGVCLTPSVKQALREESTRQNMSMSSYVSNAVIEKLTNAGVEFPPDAPVYAGEPLPFEEEK